MSVTIQGQDIEFTLTRVKNSRGLRMTMSITRGLLVRAPASYSKEKVFEILRASEKWILKHYEKQEVQRAALQQSTYEEGSDIPYLGTSYKLKLTPAFQTGASVRFENDELIMEYPFHMLSRPDQDQVRYILTVWYNRKARYLIKKKVVEFAALMGLSYGRISIKQQRSRWGSCSAKKNLNFNQRLIMAPEHIVDYVVVHELAHLKELNHSPRFWAIVQAYCPDVRGCRRWLRDHSHYLEL